MKRLLLLILVFSNVLLSSCKNNQVNEINITCEVAYPGSNKISYAEQFSIDTEYNLASIYTIYYDSTGEKWTSIEHRLGNLTVTPKKYIIQWELKGGVHQLRNTYSLDKNDVSKVKTIFEIGEDSNYRISGTNFIEKYGTYTINCVKRKLY